MGVPSVFENFQPAANIFSRIKMVIHMWAPNGLAGGIPACFQGATDPQETIWMGPDYDSKRDPEIEALQLFPAGKQGSWFHPVRKEEKDALYDALALKIFWPLCHSLEKELDAGIDSLGPKGQQEEALNAAYAHFKAVQERSSKVAAQNFPDSDVFWAQDARVIGARNSNAKTNIYTHHTPFPSWDFLKTVRIDDKRLVDTDFWKDLMKTLATSYDVITVHRPQDARYLAEALRHADPEGFEFLDQESQAQRYGNIRAFGKVFALQPVIVGPSLKENLKEARENDVPTALRITNTAMGFISSPSDSLEERERKIVIIKKAIPSFDEKEQTFNLEQTLADAAEGGKAVYFIGGRADYTKGHKELIVAIRQLFREHPERLADTSFVLTIEPTRASDGVTMRYQCETAQAALEGMAEFPENIKFAPASIPHPQFMATFASPHIAGFVALSQTVDGHCLVPREAVNVNRNPLLRVLISAGIGAVEVLHTGAKNLGAFVTESVAPGALVRMFNRMATTSPKEIMERAKNMKEASAGFTPEKFVNEALGHAIRIRGIRNQLEREEKLEEDFSFSL